MKKTCPNSKCQSSLTIKKGKFKRKSNSKLIQRYLCKACGKHFSSSTGTPSYRQKNRAINTLVFDLLCSGMSMRRCAKIAKVSRGTIERRLSSLSLRSEIRQKRLLKKLKVTHLQFDDMISSEHTKMKPLSISLAVDAQKRLILGAQVSKIPAFGLLAKKSQKKYGKRKSEHKEGLDLLFKKIEKSLDPQCLVQSDEHHLYPQVVQSYLPKATYKRHKGGRGCIVGQAELKKLRFDPLFILNHTCAMFRANISRLIRKTWCTTKKVDNLQRHINIFIDYFNSKISNYFLLRSNQKSQLLEGNGVKSSA